MHLFDRPHDGAVVGRAEQGCAQADEDQEYGGAADGDVREQGECRQPQGRQDEADRGDASRAVFIRQVAGPRRQEGHDDGLDQEDGSGYSRRQAEDDLEIEGQQEGHGIRGAVLDEGSQVGHGKSQVAEQIEWQQGVEGLAFMDDEDDQQDQANPEKSTVIFKG